MVGGGGGVSVLGFYYYYCYYYSYSCSYPYPYSYAYSSDSSTPVLLYSFLPSECVKMQNVSRFVQDLLGCCCLTWFTYNLTNELGALSTVCKK